MYVNKMEVCSENKEILNHVGLQLKVLYDLVKERKNLRKIQDVMTRIDNDLNKVGENILDLDDTIGKMAVTLEELKEEAKHIHTSIVADPSTGKILMSHSYDKLKRRHRKYLKKLNYYCHLYHVIEHQIAAQKLANEMAREGFIDGDEFNFLEEDIESVKMRRDAMKIGPHFNKLLQEFSNSK
jgi:hypothetical protein